MEQIKAGNSNIRNHVLMSYAAKGLLPYHGIGSGIRRALRNRESIDLVDDGKGPPDLQGRRRHCLTKKAGAGRPAPAFS